MKAFAVAATTLLLAHGALAQDARFVVMYRLHASHWNMVLLPPEARESMKRIVRPGVDLVDWSAFKSDPQRYLAPLVVKNEYPATNLPKLVVDLLQEYSGIPIAVTWTGGIGISNGDRDHAERIYQLFRANPQEYERTKLSGDKLLDPIHPEHRLAVETAQKAQTPWWTCQYDEEPKPRTPEQQRRLENFSRDRFSLKASGSDRRDAVFSRSDLVRVFGPPLDVARKKVPRDPQDPTDKTLRIATTWKYRGLTIVTVAEESSPDRLSISEGDVYDAGIVLGSGVGVGQPIDQWERQFGRPRCTVAEMSELSQYNGRHAFEYGWEDRVGEMRIITDASGKVVRVTWRPGSH